MLYQTTLLKDREADAIFLLIITEGEETALRFLEEKYGRSEGAESTVRPWPLLYKVYSDDSPFIMAYDEKDWRVYLVRVVLAESSHTPEFFDQVEPVSTLYGAYRIKNIAYSQIDTLTEPERRVMQLQDKGNARLIKSSSNAFKRLARLVEADAVQLAEFCENCSGEDLSSLITAIRNIIYKLRTDGSLKQ